MKMILRSLLGLSLALGVTFLWRGAMDTNYVANAAAGSGSPYASEWRITGPTGGDVRALVVDPNDPSRFYFGTLDGQIYVSTDAGRNWRLLVNFNRPLLFVDHIIVDPRNSKVLYVAAHRHKEAGGFFKSSDGGATWREAPELRNEALHSLTQSDSNPNVMLTGTISGIFKSTDSGETWQALPTRSTAGLIDVESLAIDPRNSDVIYAGTWYLPYKSVDGGQTWRIIKNGIIDDSDIFAINIDPRDNRHVIASACSGIYETHDGGDRWQKVQGIPSQSRRTRAILQHPSVAGVVFAGTTEGFWRSARGGENNSWMVTTSRQLEINSIAVHPRNPDMVYIGTNNYGVMISSDGGKNFVPSNAGFSGRFVNSITPDRENANRVYATTINTTTGGGFFFVSSDGGSSWQPSMRNMPPRLIAYSVLQDESDGNTIYLGTNLGVYRSADRGASWAPVATRKVPSAPAKKRAAPRTARRRAPATTAARTQSAAKRKAAPATAQVPTAKPKASDDTVRRAQMALDRAGYEIGTPDGQMGPRTVAAVKRFQTDRYLPLSGNLDETTLAALGVTPGGSASGTSHVPFISDPVNSLASYSDKNGAHILAATNSGLFRTSDPAQGWDRVSYGRGFDVRTTCIAVSPHNPSMLMVGTTTSGVLVSRDSGETWQQVAGVPATSPVNVIVEDPQRSNLIYVGTKQSLYVSRDGGQQWMRRGGNLPFGDFTSILVNPRNPDEILVANAFQLSGRTANGQTGGGVFLSDDAGVTWKRLDTSEHNLPSVGIWALAFDSREPTKVFVGSHSAGVYVLSRGSQAMFSGSQR